MEIGRDGQLLETVTFEAESDERAMELMKVRTEGLSKESLWEFHLRVEKEVATLARGKSNSTYVAGRDTKYDSVQWGHMMKSLWMFGVVDDFTAGTCHRYAERLKTKVASGEVEKTKMGHNAFYRINPELLERFGASGRIED